MRARQNRQEPNGAHQLEMFPELASRTARAARNNFKGNVNRTANFRPKISAQALGLRDLLLRQGPPGSYAEHERQ